MSAARSLSTSKARSPSTTAKESAAKQGHARQSHPDQSPTTINNAFTVIVPDEKKRQRILQQAKNEEKAYEQHKRSNRPTHVSMKPRRLGDGSAEDHPTSLPEVRTRQQRQLSTKGPFQAAQNVRAQRAKAAEAAEKKLESMKLDARRKAEKKETAKDDVDAESLRAKRLQFLGL